MKIAIALFNLGGPDGPAAVEPFLYNLFNDPAIIRLPWPVRPLLARFISRRRAPKAQEIYANIGGGSPLLPNTAAQARALEQALADAGDVRAFPVMRYWHPMAPDVVAEMCRFAPDRLVLLPLYPQFSTTTTASSLSVWSREAKRRGLTATATTVCCYPAQDGFIAALAKITRAGVEQARAHGRPRILFSAHGLPEKVIKAGDPYQWQVERTAAAVMARLGDVGADAIVCYQSRVGPLKWIGPSTEDELRRAGADKCPAVVVPLAFVSEHSETLVELDIEYAELAHEVGVPLYVRVPTVSTHPEFIAGLAAVTRAALARRDGAPASEDGTRLCPAQWTGCPCRAAG
jgi:protoporphyrin/coproporphyrin ferrochelatase